MGSCKHNHLAGVHGPKIWVYIYLTMDWCDSPLQAYAWYRSEPIPGFGDLTAEDMVKRDMKDTALEHLGRIAEGGYT